MAEKEDFTGFFRIKSFVNSELERFRVYLQLDFDELKKPIADDPKWEESIFNAADGNYAHREVIAKAPALEIYKWFLLNAKRSQRREDQRAIAEYEFQANQFQPRN